MDFLGKNDDDQGLTSKGLAGRTLHESYPKSVWRLRCSKVVMVSPAEGV